LPAAKMIPVTSAATGWFRNRERQRAEPRIVEPLDPLADRGPDAVGELGRLHERRAALDQILELELHRLLRRAGDDALEAELLDARLHRDPGVAHAREPLGSDLDDGGHELVAFRLEPDRKSTRLNSSHQLISYAVFCLKK